ncbi:hypothetical protein M513_02253 [Trichuris suis]|uniref:BZIP domain-containing protein n=1 Tax=Trichuris suis TaxID=68888 RepID=A0A085MIF0_9BILA|nr:hypothetical protein M513_02253 [Trichuris suis]
MNSDASLYTDRCCSPMNVQHTANYGSKGTNASSESSKTPYKANRSSPDSSVQFTGIKDVQERKRALTLDFSDSKSIRKTLDTQEVLQFLGLSSPDFERFLSQNVAVVSQTPTPTQFFYPKNVTAEQEQYARGFIDALNQIHQMRGFVPMSNLMSPGFVSNTVAQADKEDAKPLLGAFQEQFLALATTARSPVTSDNNSAPAACASGSVSTKSNGSAPVSSTSGYPVTATSPGRVPSRSTFDTSPQSTTSFSSTSSTGASCQFQRAKLHCRRPLAKPSSRHFKTATVKSACSVENKTNVNNTVPSTSPRQVVKSELMDFPMTFEFENNYMMSTTQVTVDGVANSGDFLVPAGAVSAVTLHNSPRTVSVPPNVILRNPVQQRQQTGSCFVPQLEQLPVASTSVHSAAPVSSCPNVRSNRAAASLPKVGAERASAKSIETFSCANALPSNADVACSSLASTAFASGISPIDPDLQERIKLERKRARNRIAATKCRRRKIEKINELESRVCEISAQNKAMVQRIDLLRVDVTRLRETVRKHRMNGCVFNDEIVRSEAAKEDGLGC